MRRLARYAPACDMQVGSNDGLKRSAVDDTKNLIASLAHWLAVGKLDARLVLPAIQKLAGEDGKSASLLMVLAGLEGENRSESCQPGQPTCAMFCEGKLCGFMRKEAGREPISNDDSALLTDLSFDPSPEWNWLGDPATRPWRVSFGLPGRSRSWQAASEWHRNYFAKVNYRFAQNTLPRLMPSSPPGLPEFYHC